MKLKKAKRDGSGGYRAPKPIEEGFSHMSDGMKHALEGTTVYSGDSALRNKRPITTGGSSSPMPSSGSRCRVDNKG
jgi:hypothetical protein